MSPVKAMLYFMCVNGMLALFTTIGVFSQAASLGTSYNVDLISSLGDIGFTGIATITGALTMYVSYKVGLNPFLAMAYGVVVGFFVKTFATVFGVMTNIANSVPEGSAIIYGFIGLISSIYAVSVIWTLVQMSSGGFETYE